MIIIQLDREREIRFNTRAIIEAETILNMPFTKIVESEGFAIMRGLLWAGLRHEDRALSIDQINGFMDTLREQGRMGEVMPKIKDALEESKFLMPDPNKEG